MKSRLELVIRALATIQHYKNPLHIIRKRLLAKKNQMMTIVDRQTGIQCECPLGAFHLFAETWYLNDYDVPHLPVRRGDTVFDVGANHGFFALYAANKGAKVYAFEPNPIVFERLEKNIRRNGLEQRITARPWALSDEEGEVKLLITEMLGGAMSTIHSGFAEKSQIPVSGQIVVPCHTLSEAIRIFGLETIRLCKIDAEGSELAILHGLQQADRARVESLVLEYHPGAYQVHELLSGLLEWGTHQISFMDEAQFGGNVLRVISNKSLIRSV